MVKVVRGWCCGWFEGLGWLFDWGLAACSMLYNGWKHGIEWARVRSSSGSIVECSACLVGPRGGWVGWRFGEPNGVSWGYLLAWNSLFGGCLCWKLNWTRRSIWGLLVEWLGMHGLADLEGWIILGCDQFVMPCGILMCRDLRGVLGGHEYVIIMI